MAEPAQRSLLAEEQEPPVDPGAVRSAYSYHRARRRAIIEQRRRRRRARIRFWFVLAILTGASVYLAIVVWQQIQSLFGF